MPAAVQQYLRLKFHHYLPRDPFAAASLMWPVYPSKLPNFVPHYFERKLPWSTSIDYLIPICFECLETKTHSV